MGIEVRVGGSRGEEAAPMGINFAVGELRANEYDKNARTEEAAIENQAAD